MQLFKKILLPTDFSTHGRTGLARLVSGSVAERVVRLAPCPVLSVKPACWEKPAEMPAFQAGCAVGGRE